MTLQDQIKDALNGDHRRKKRGKPRAEGEPEMALTTDDEAAEVARLEEEAAQRQYEERLAIVEKQRAAAQQLEARARAAAEQATNDRMAAKDAIRDALETLANADGMLLSEVEAENAVWGTRLTDQRPTAPSLGGQTPHNTAKLEREVASAAQAVANDKAARERWIASERESIRNLQAGQEPSQQAAIAAAFRAQVQKG